VAESSVTGWQVPSCARVAANSGGRPPTPVPSDRPIAPNDDVADRTSVDALRSYAREARSTAAIVRSRDA
jgi:hypothetical protein